MERGWNVHHVLWQRRDYKTAKEKELRNYSGLVIPMYKSAHNELHAVIPPPPKLNARLIHGSLDMLNNLPKPSVDDPLRVVTALALYLERSDERLAQRVSDHLFEQADMIEDGFYVGQAA